MFKGFSCADVASHRHLARTILSTPGTTRKFRNQLQYFECFSDSTRVTVWIPKTGTRQWHDTLNFSDVLKTYVPIRRGLPGVRRQVLFVGSHKLPRKIPELLGPRRSIRAPGQPSPARRGSTCRCRDMPLNQHTLYTEHFRTYRLSFSQSPPSSASESPHPDSTRP